MKLETRCGRGLIKDCFDNVKELGNISPICVKIGSVSVVEQIISSSKRITMVIQVQVELGHYKFDLSSSSWMAYESREQCSVWFSPEVVWLDGWCKTAPCWLLTTMSSGSGCFSWCPLLIPWKSKITKTQSEVSKEIWRYKLLDNYLCQDLPENEPAIISRTKECTTVEDRVTETNSKAAVRGLILTILPSLWHFCVKELPEIELVPIASATKECTSVEDRVMETNPKAAVRG